MNTNTLTATTTDHDDCEPAWTEEVHHPAEGEEFIMEANPDYVAPTYTPAHTVWVDPVYTPAVGAPTIEVEQENPTYVPAEPETTETVYHEAVTATQWKYVKNGGKGEVWLDNNHQHKVKINGHWYQRTNKTKEVTITEAWEETVVTPGTDAIGEPTIWVTIDNPDYVAPTYTPGYDKHVPAQYTPAEGDEYIDVENPDYVPAWTEYIEHEAECTVPAEEQDTTPTTPQKPAEQLKTITTMSTTTTAPQDAPESAQLAQTGVDALTPLLLAGAALAALGATLITKKLAKTRS